MHFWWAILLPNREVFHKPKRFLFSFIFYSFVKLNLLQQAAVLIQRYPAHLNISKSRIRIILAVLAPAYTSARIVVGWLWQTSKNGKASWASSCLSPFSPATSGEEPFSNWGSMLERVYGIEVMAQLDISPSVPGWSRELMQRLSERSAIRIQNTGDANAFLKRANRLQPRATVCQELHITLRQQMHNPSLWVSGGMASITLHGSSSFESIRAACCLAAYEAVPLSNSTTTGLH